MIGENVRISSLWLTMLHLNHVSLSLHFIWFLLTLTSKLTLPFPKPAWSRTWFLEVSIGSALINSSRDSLLEVLDTLWCCCLLVFLTSWSWCISAEDWRWSGLSSSNRLGGLLNIFLLCSASLCCISGGICSGSGVSSSGGGSSTETRLATREDGNTAVTTRVTLKGKGA